MKRAMFYLILTLIFGPSSYGQSYYFRNYQVESGLSNNAVMCTIEDQSGFMWFGTRDGLNRFDGNHFKTYNFAQNNLIHSLCIDQKGSLIVATESSVYKYVPISDSFLLLFSSEDYFIDQIIADMEGNLWFNASGRISCFDLKTKKIKNEISWNKEYVTSLCMGRNGVVWIGTGNGKLKKYDKLTNRFASYDIFASTGEKGFESIDKIRSAGNKILVGTFKRGFGIFNLDTYSYSDIHLAEKHTKQLIIRDFMQNNLEEVWIASETGIYIYNLLTGDQSKIQKYNNDKFSLADDVVYSLTKDREGGVWIGTYFGGINYLPKAYTPFDKLYSTSPVNALSGNIVRELTKDRLGNLWICTEDGGLNKVDAKTGLIRYYKPSPSSASIAYKSTHSLLAVDNELWLGTYEHGLDIIDIRSGKVLRHYDAASNRGLQSDFPFCFFRTEAGKILVGSDNGLYSYEAKTDFFKHVEGFPKSGLFTAIMEDNNGLLWASISGKGLYYYDLKKGLCAHFNHDEKNPFSLASNKINAIFKDSKGTLWIATEAGLCKYNEDKRNFLTYNQQQGFPSNFILSILEDRQNQLWVSTTKGLVCFDPKNNRTVTYTTSNGLLSNQFNFSSAYIEENGRLYFGSAEGLISFNPANFVLDHFVPKVYIVSLHVNEIRGSKYTDSIIEASSRKSGSIILEHSQSSLTIEYSALSYTAPEAIRYAYKLNGVSENWTYIKNLHSLVFPKLPTGNYLFRIKASSSSGVWNNEETKLSIKVLPPWWESQLAIACYIFILLTTVVIIFKTYHKWIKDKHQRKLEKLEIASEKEILESKIDFYTQVAHEIRTPLTLIKIPLGKVIRNTAGISSIANSLKIIGGNTDRLIELANQLLDFRQAELKSFSLNFEKVDIAAYLQSASDDFFDLAESQGITVKLEGVGYPFIVSADTDAIKKITYNLLGNAVKYAIKNVIVSLSESALEDEYLTISFKNDGNTIPLAYQKKIFEPFFRMRDMDGTIGSGIGLALALSLTIAHRGKLEYNIDSEGMNVFLLALPIAYKQK